MWFALVLACTTEAPPETTVTAPPAPTAMATPDAAVEHDGHAASADEGIACDHEHGAQHVVAATVLPEFKDMNGRLACPVMGDVVASAAESSGYADYEGVRYYFCCVSCAERFAQNPAAFADGKFLRQEGIWPAAAGQQG
jgi:YHS domain-containing protein